MNTNEDGLTKIYIDLPNHWAIGGEALWAEPLGNDTYKIENVPFYAYGLNFQDIVQAIPLLDGLKPQVTTLIKPSGHRTFRVFFRKHINREEQEDMLDSLRTFGASFERDNEYHVAIDVKPDADYNGIYDELERHLEQEAIYFETCEERVKGSFDDAPEERQT